MPWHELIAARDAILGRTVQIVRDAIGRRPPGPRHEGNDNAIFGELTNNTVIAIGESEYRVAISMFHPCYEAALDYEAREGCQIHKGAPCFNVGVAYLRAYNFAAAMHYFELAQRESREASGDPGWDVYQNDLFERNFWNTIDASAEQYPLAIYEELWRTPFNKAAAMADWDGLTGHSKILYIMANARRVRYRQLAERSRWDGSDSLALVYWTLAADLARLLETELKRRTGDNRTLFPVLADNFHRTPLGDLSTDFVNLHDAYGVSDPASYNAAFPPIRTAIQDASRPRRERVSNSIYLHYATRNQVAHQVDIGMELFTAPASTRFTSDVLLSLCRLRDWAV